MAQEITEILVPETQKTARETAKKIYQSSKELGIRLDNRLQTVTPEQLQKSLEELESEGLPVKEVINYGIPRYNRRTCIHLAAANGLWECLELMLKRGG